MTKEIVVFIEVIFLLHPQQDLSIAPQLFKVIILTHIWREEMHDHISIVEDQPALFRPPFDASLFLVFLLGGFQHTFGKRVEHAVARAVADDEIIRK